METIREDARDIPVAHECDVCVVGGSCTGVFAALAAARLGARVAIVEQNGYFGGMATGALVNVWHSMFDTVGERQIIGGMTAEAIDRLKRRDAVIEYTPEPGHNLAFNSAEMAIELDEMVTEAGIRAFLHCMFVRPVVEGDRITAAIVEDKSGRRAIRASFFIDASGDGDLIARAGLPTRTAEHLQPPTTCAIIGGLDTVAARNEGFDLAGAACDPRYPEALKPGFLWSSRVPGIPGARMVAGTRVAGANCACADELTAAEIEGRRQVRAMCDVLRRHFDGGDDVALLALAAQIGIRETRHAQCLHTLTEHEVLHGARFDDAIANGTYRVDIHHDDRPGVTFRYLDGREEYHTPGRPKVTGRWREQGEECATFYQVPYRSLAPPDAANLLVAGRIIDADRGAYGAVRVMVNCNQTGEAAGAAAWLALDQNRDARRLDTAELRRVLIEHGAIVI